MNLQVRVQIPLKPDAPSYERPTDVHVTSDPELVARILETITAYERERRETAPPPVINVVNIADVKAELAKDSDA